MAVGRRRRERGNESGRCRRHRRLADGCSGLPGGCNGPDTGWDAKALWDDIKFSATHCTKIKRIALVGDKMWEKWMAKVCKPFTMAKIMYFDAKEIDAAKAWLAEG